MQCVNNNIMTNNMFRLVCPTCVMFHGHKLHVVIPPEEAVKNLRDLFDVNIKSGNHKVKYQLTLIRQAQDREHGEHISRREAVTSPV